MDCWRGAQEVAAAFKDSDAIIGYELINEPFAGDVWADPFLLLPWVADQLNLQPFYDAVAPLLREADNRSDHIVFFEPVTWSGLPILSNATVGFTHAPGGAAQAFQSGLAWHYYSLPNIGSQADYFDRRVEVGAGVGLHNRCMCSCARCVVCSKTHDWIPCVPFLVLQAASLLNVGSLVTEFDISDDVASMTASMDIMDQHLLSWIGWEYKGFGECGCSSLCGAAAAAECPH